MAVNEDGEPVGCDACDRGDHHYTDTELCVCCDHDPYAIVATGDAGQRVPCPNCGGIIPQGGCALCWGEGTVTA